MISAVLSPKPWMSTLNISLYPRQGPPPSPRSTGRSQAQLLIPEEFPGICDTALAAPSSHCATIKTHFTSQEPFLAAFIVIAKQQ